MIKMDLAASCRHLFSVVSFVLAVSILTQPVQAIPPMVEEFKAIYPDLADAATAAKCNVCHVDGKKKSVHNRFGM